ncbi:MAG TPA: PAS domain S-box protein [Candidatus Acidoferrales bacterium]|nr:PAS domain S-box protein [Candidatus Acidoferrales bacterium]
MPLAHSSIRRKLTRIVLITSGAALVVSCVIFGAYDVYISRWTKLQSLATLAQITGANSSAAVSFDDTKSAGEILNSLRSEKQIIHAALYSEEGRVLATYSRDNANVQFTPPLIGEDEARFAGNRIIVFRTIEVNGHPAGVIYIESDISAILAREQGLAAMLGIALLASLLVALIVGPRLQKPITEPILELARTAFAVSLEKNYSIRAASRSTDEIGYLYTQFNQMLERIQQRDTELEQIRADLENRVAERTAFLSALIDSVPLGLIASDQHGAVLSINPAFSRMFGYSREESVGKDLDELIVPAELLAEGNEYTRKRIEGQSIQFESQRKRKDGSLVDVEVHGVPLFIQEKIVGGFALYQDVTERLHAEEAIRKSNTMLKALIDGSPLAIVVTEIDGIARSINPAFSKLFGYSAEEMIGANLDDRIAPTELLAEARALTRGRPEGEIIQLETRRKRKDGHLVDVELHSVPIRMQGETVVSFAIYQDISQRKQAELALRDANGKLNAIIQASPLGIVTTDRTGRILLCNPSFEKLFQLSSEDAAGAELNDLIVPRELKAESEELTRRGQAGETIHATTKRQRKDGTVLDVELYGVSLSVGGERVGGLVLYQDISARRRAEESLRKLSQALEQSAESVVITDKSGVIEYVNPCFVELTGYSKEEAAGHTPRILKSGKHLLGFYQNFWAIILAGEVYRGIFVNKKKSGELFYEEKTIAPVKDAQGTITNFVSVGRDITQRRRAEEELRMAKEAAEQANRAKSDFLANMSHEIRTPMNGIIGMTDLTLETELSTEQRDYLEMVKTSADSLLHVINDILDFSKVEAGKLELEHEPFALWASIGETMKVLGHLAHRKKLELAWQAAADVPDWVVGDRGRLRQMLVNLVGNAIKFTERGEVVVSVSVANLAPEGVELHFRISDTGIGIPLEKQKLIFEAFTQADGSTTRKYGGTGLGLAIVQRLVSLQGGRLWVESGAGKGSVFHFTIRLGLPDKSFIPPKELESCVLRGLRALVVDDNRTNRLILLDLMRRWGMEPEEAQNWKEALEILERAQQEGNAFRLAILDAQMPEMDGFTLARRIRENHNLSSVAMIILSSAAQPGDAARSKEAGISSYLIKPAQPSELLDAIMNTVGNHINARRDPAYAPQPSIPESCGPGLRILLAEDNAVNRQLAIRLLEKRGHFVEAVIDGRQALEALERERFDLVLMDVQMPELDGLEATRTIRSREKNTGAHQLIISVTAHVMKGDREKCIEAGADDYISKPIQSEDLYAAIERLRSASIIFASSDQKSSSAFSTDVLDSRKLLERVQGDRELLADMIRLFRAEALSLLQTLREAVENGDCSAISRTSHALKGAIGNFGSGPAYQATQNMEELARTGDVQAAGALLSVLEREIERLQAALEPFSGAVVK